MLVQLSFEGESQPYAAEIVDRTLGLVVSGVSSAMTVAQRAAPGDVENVVGVLRSGNRVLYTATVPTSQLDGVVAAFEQATQECKPKELPGETPAPAAEP